MSGRFTQTMSIRKYAAAIGWAKEEVRELGASDFLPNYNCAPGNKYLVFRLVDGKPIIEMVPWQWLSGWAKKEGKQPAIAAKREKLLSPYYRSLMKKGRVIVPASGWYEWTGEKGKKQPWYVQAKSRGPLFFAALTNHMPDKEDSEGAGFVIVTDDIAGGLIDTNDRRPVVLNAEDASLWMDLEFPYEQAEQIARLSNLREGFFEWYKVSTAVNNLAQHDEHLTAPMPKE